MRNPSKATIKRLNKILKSDTGFNSIPDNMVVLWFEIAITHIKVKEKNAKRNQDLIHFKNTFLIPNY